LGKFKKKHDFVFRDIFGERDLNEETVTNYTAKLLLTKRYEHKNISIGERAGCFSMTSSTKCFVLKT
jgi:hypothetical protein